MNADNIDLSEIADNAYEASVAQENDNQDSDQDQPVDTEQDQPVVDETQQEDNTEETTDSEADDEATQETEQEQGDGEEAGDDNQPSNGGEQKETEQASQITDEQLRAELERRGLSVVDQRQQQNKQQTDERFARPQEVPEEIWGRMPDENRYIYNQLPYLEVRGKDGNVIRVKTDDQIPDGFEWASETEKNRFFAKDLPAQSLRAERLNDEITVAKQRYAQRTQQQSQARYVVDTVNKLQREGYIPKFTAKRGTKEFDSDPGVIQANEIIGLWQQHQQQGERLSLETAAMLYKAQHPEKYVKKPATTPTDKVRKQKSTNINGGSRGTPKDAQGGNNIHSFPTGTMPSDIADYYLDKLDQEDK